MGFSIDTGQSGGSQGPWLHWYASGSMAKNVQPQTWIIRDRDDDDNATITITNALANGAVFDLSTLKLGYTADDGSKGVAPSRRYAPTPNLSNFPNPEPEKKRGQGGDWWQKTVHIRVALSQTQAVTWEQAGFSAFDAFARVAPQIVAGYAANGGENGMCPVIKQTGVETIPSKRGQPAHVPILSVVKWVPKPPCLQGDAPVINTGAAAPAAAPAPAAAQTPAQQPAPANAGMDDEIPF